MKIALPNKGSLAESSVQILKEAGYRQRTDVRDLVLLDNDNGIEFYYLRPRDIALYVGSGELDAGITGRDLLVDSQADAEEILALGFGRSTFRFAAPKDAGSKKDISSLAGKRIASAYPGLVADYLDREKIKAEIIRLDGAVESSVKLGVADVIADVVSTGNTLRQAGLEVFGEILLESEAILIKRSGTKQSQELETLIRNDSNVLNFPLI